MKCSLFQIDRPVVAGVLNYLLYLAGVALTIGAMISTGH